ncbi:MAG TPA: Ran-binding zinc finger domain-containing protein [Planctomycetota bacterium]|nr:Ran-binding zinc finger domain-containing protein [Planctomycetota bacterium]
MGGWLAFGKGGCALFLLLFLAGVVISATGNFSMAPILGPVLVFLVGGLVSLIGYHQGKNDTALPPPIRPPSGAWYWTCSSCARLNAPSSKHCLNCSAERPAKKEQKSDLEGPEGH